MSDDVDWTMIIVVLICAGALFLFGGIGGAAPAGTGTSSNTTTNSTHNQAELLSRNQFVIGDVTNCYGDGSCPDTATTTENTSNTTTRIDGDRNSTITLADGTIACESKDMPNAGNVHQVRRCG